MYPRWTDSISTLILGLHYSIDVRSCLDTGKLGSKKNQKSGHLEFTFHQNHSTRVSELQMQLITTIVGPMLDQR